jgi:hypothetical protein
MVLRLAQQHLNRQLSNVGSIVRQAGHQLA